VSVQVPSFSSRVDGLCGDGNDSDGAQNRLTFIALEVPHPVGGTILWKPLFLSWTDTFILIYFNNIYNKITITGSYKIRILTAL